MLTEFECPSCGHRIGAAEDGAGRKAHCPGCGAVVVVPVPSDTPGDREGHGRPWAAGAIGVGLAALLVVMGWWLYDDGNHERPLKVSEPPVTLEELAARISELETQLDAAKTELENRDKDILLVFFTLRFRPPPPDAIRTDWHDVTSDAGSLAYLWDCDISEHNEMRAPRGLRQAARGLREEREKALSEQKSGD
jgi:hypothetical protein